MAGGHLHSFISYPKDKPYFFIPGSTEFWNVLNEKNNSKGVIIFDTDTLEYEFSELSTRTRIEKEFTYENDIIGEFEEFSKNLGLTGEELVIVNIKLKDSGYVNVNELEKILESNGALKGYIKLRYPNSIFDRNLGEEGYYSVRDVEREIINYWEEFSDAEKITSYLQKFKEYQEENDREKDFFELFDTMLEEEIGNENK